jgi:hypothetical protein
MLLPGPHLRAGLCIGEAHGAIVRGDGHDLAVGRERPAP